MSQEQIIKYPLSDAQNKFATLFDRKVGESETNFQKAKLAFEQASTQRQIAKDSLDLFLSYCIEEFRLPPTKQGYSLAETAIGKYALTGLSVDDLETAPEPEPKPQE